MTNLLNTDLNLIRPLDALLTERSVTRAGLRVGVGQSSMSASLRRLRRYFDDELLIRVGDHYELTPLAEHLSPRVREVLRMLDETLTANPGFDPSTSTRPFQIVSSDYAVQILFPELMPRLREAAPNLKVTIHPVSPTIIEAPHDAMRSYDLLLTPRGQISGLPSLDLFEDQWTCISGRPFEQGALRAEHLSSIAWARPFSATGTAADRRVDEAGPESRVGIVVASLALLPYAVSNTDLFAMVPERLLRLLEPGLTFYRIPVESIPVPPLREATWWHPLRDNDAGNRWLRTFLRDAVSYMPSL